MALGLRLVPVASNQCSWCNGYNGSHHERCYVRAFIPQQQPPQPEIREPTSRELYSAAVERGETAGHQWGKQNDTR